MGKARNQIDGHGLAGTGPAEQGSNARVVLERDVEIKGAELQRNVNTDHVEPAMRTQIQA
jgi:hypothetical protein